MTYTASTYVWSLNHAYPAQEPSTDYWPASVVPAVQICHRHNFSFPTGQTCPACTVDPNTVISGGVLED